MNTTQIVRLTLVFAALAVAACGPKRSDHIDVDSVQGKANDVEGYLRELRNAMRESDPKRARDAYEKARDALEENRQSLEAYPDFQELAQTVEEAGPEVCMFAVKTALERLFECIRGQDLDCARDRFKEAQEERDRCLKTIEEREEYAALKMSIESAPKALTDLEAALARPALLEKMKSVLTELGEDRAAIAEKLSKLEANPNQPELGAEIGEKAQALRQELSKTRDFATEPEWVAFASNLAGELDEYDRRQPRLTRRGKLHAAVERLSEAAKGTAFALKAMQPERKELFEKAVGTYRECRVEFGSLVREEPAILTYELLFEGKKRKVRWIQMRIDVLLAAAERESRRTAKPPKLGPKPTVPGKKPPRNVKRW